MPLQSSDLKAVTLLENHLQRQALQLARLRDQISRIENFADRVSGAYPGAGSLGEKPTPPLPPNSVVNKLDLADQELLEVTDRAATVAGRLEKIA